jgi:hypothetical protein
MSGLIDQSRQRSTPYSTRSTPREVSHVQCSTWCATRQHLTPDLKRHPPLTSPFSSRLFEHISSEILVPQPCLEASRWRPPAPRDALLLLDPDTSTFLIPSVYLTGGIASGLGSLPDMLVMVLASCCGRQRDQGTPAAHDPSFKPSAAQRHSSFSMPSSIDIGGHGRVRSSGNNRADSRVSRATPETPASV